MNQIAKHWKEYECIDCGNGEKLERWKDITLRRPDPQVIWPSQENQKNWNAQAHYHRSKAGGGSWEFREKIKEHWNIRYKHLTFKVSPTGFKHTGIFPEQAANWDYMMDKIQASTVQDIRVLNLFAYTGGATLACASAGASEVVHVDASKGMVQWAKENVELSQLTNKKIRFIVEDCVKFVQREARRGRTYHVIIMDPPSYGRGPNNEIWKIEEQLYPLVNACLDILDKDAFLFLVNSYTTGFSATVLSNVLNASVLKRMGHGFLTTGEIGLPITKSNTILPCGIYGRWEK